MLLLPMVLWGGGLCRGNYCCLGLGQSLRLTVPSGSTRLASWFQVCSPLLPADQKAVLGAAEMACPLKVLGSKPS